MAHLDPACVTDAAIEDTVFTLLAKRRTGATICPSEVARALAPDAGSWRPLMPRIRQVAQVLAGHKRLTVTRGGVPVEATSPGGPIRLGRVIERDDTCCGPRGPRPLAG